MDKAKFLGSWEIAGAGDESPDYQTARQRIEFFEDGTVVHFWGGSRAETQSWHQDPEIARGRWRVTGGRLRAVFRYGSKWAGDQRGKPMRDMVGDLAEDGSTIAAHFKRTSLRLGPSWEGPHTLMRRE